MKLEVEYLICLDEMSISAPDKVYGFLQINLDNQLYGYCPNDDINLPASDILSIWFEQLAEVFAGIQSHEYMLINDIDSFNSWIEIKRCDDTEVEISHIIANS